MHKFTANIVSSFCQQHTTPESNSEKKMKCLTSLNTDQKKGFASEYHQIIRAGADKFANSLE